MKDIEFPSILEQLKTGFASRRQLDIALLQVMGYSSEEAAHLLESLYPALAGEIQKLRTIMEG
jgi:hypothetical protein